MEHRRTAGLEREKMGMSMSVFFFFWVGGVCEGSIFGIQCTSDMRNYFLSIGKMGGDEKFLVEERGALSIFCFVIRLIYVLLDIWTSLLTHANLGKKRQTSNYFALNTPVILETIRPHTVHGWRHT